jgi:hypothetical protein
MLYELIECEGAVVIGGDVGNHLSRRKLSAAILRLTPTTACDQ